MERPPRHPSHRRTPELKAPKMFWAPLCILLIAGFVWLFPPNLQKIREPDSPPPGSPTLPALFVYPVALSEANAACSNKCTISVCVRWIPKTDPDCKNPGPGGGCCTDYEDQCDPDCQDDPVYQPPTISGSQTCAQTGANGWCTGALTLDLTASDPQGQTVLISGDVDGTAFACTNGATSCAVALPEGEGTVNFLVTSATGLSASGSQSYERDGTAPAINGSLSGSTGDNGWYVSAVSASASATDAVSGVDSFEYSLNGGAWTDYSSAISLGDGEHTLDFRATDEAGNQNEISQEVKIDTLTPTLDLALTGTNGSNGWYTSGVTAAASASDAGSGLDELEYSLDGGAWTTYTSALALSDGEHSLSVRATDEAGNETQIDEDIDVDTITPVIDLSVTGTSGTGGWFVSDIEVSASGSDTGSGIDSFEYSLDGGAWTTYTSAFTYTDGERTLRFRAIDAAGNTTATPEITYGVDTVPPVIDLPASWNLGEAAAYEVTDSQSGVASVRIVIEDEAELYAKLTWYGDAEDTIPWDGRFADGVRAADREYYLTLKATDRAGNENTKEAVITVENSLLTLLIPPFTPSTAEPPLASGEGGGEGDSTSFGGESNGGGSSWTTGFTAGGKTTVAGGAGVATFATVSPAAESGASPLAGASESDILWGATALAAVGAFSAEIARRKREEAEASAEAIERRAKKKGKKDKPRLTYKQIAQAYQASIDRFRAMLQKARDLGMSESEAARLKSEVARTGQIGASLDNAKTHIVNTIAAREIAVAQHRYTEQHDYNVAPPETLPPMGPPALIEAPVETIPFWKFWEPGWNLRDAANILMDTLTGSQGASTPPPTVERIPINASEMRLLVQPEEPLDLSMISLTLPTVSPRIIPAGTVLPEKKQGDGLHGVLDVIGLVPGLGVGEAADLINAALYASEGRNLEAGVSVAAVLVFGDFLKGGKWAVKVGSETLELTTEATLKATLEAGADLAARQAMEGVGEHIAERLAREAMEKAAREAAQQAIALGAKKAAQAALEKVTKEIGEAIPVSVMKEVSERAAREFAETSAEQAAREAAEKALKQVSDYQAGLLKYQDFLKEMTELSENTKALIPSPKPAQFIDNLDEIYREAGEATPELQEMITGLAVKTEGMPQFPPDLKDLQRTLEKIAEDYDGDVSLVTDITRGRIVYPTLKDLYRALDEMSPDSRLVYFKDRFLDPLQSGYRDILMNVRLSNGHVGELRLEVAPMNAAAEIEHKLYELRRSIPKPLSPEGELLFERLEKESRDIFDAAWKQVIADLGN